MTSISSEAEDFRALSAIDTHHKALGRVADGWFARTGYTFLSVRSPSEDPLAAVALKYPDPCPIDRTADTRILYWLSNPEKPTNRVTTALAESVRQIKAEMEGTGSARVWGAVPKTAERLLAFLDRMTEAGIGRKVDGSSVGEGEYRNFIFYIGGRAEAGDFLGARQ